jgi:hypothetical protein
MLSNGNRLDDIFNQPDEPPCDILEFCEIVIQFFLKSTAADPRYSGPANVKNFRGHTITAIVEAGKFCKSEEGLQAIKNLRMMIPNTPAAIAHALADVDT